MRHAFKRGGGELARERKKISAQPLPSKSTQVPSPPPVATSLRSFLFGLPTKKATNLHDLQPSQTEQRGVELYTWGEGGSGQLGHGDDKSTQCPSKVNHLARKGFSLSSAVQLSCGLMHCGAVNSEGEVFTWGNNLFMQVGHDIGGFMASLGSNEYKPGSLRLLLPTNFVCQSMACGAWHTLIVGDIKGQGEEDKRAVFVWGNGTHAQLGMETERSFKTKKMMGSNYQFPVELKDLTLPLSHPSRIKIVSAGTTHSCALTNDGEVYMWGNKQIPAPMKMDLGGHKFKEVVCGAYHTLGLTDGGDVYMWGGGKISNLLMEATLDPYYFQPSRTAIPSSIQEVVRVNVGRVTSIAAGNDFSAAVTEAGDMFVWTSTDPTPRIVSELEGKKVTNIGISLTHIAAITESGGLYMWRISEEHKPHKKHREELPAHLQVHFTHDPCPSPAPIRIQGELQDKTVTGIKMGWNFALASTIPRHTSLKRRFVI